MLVDISDGSIDAVVVYHLDRLTRRPKEFEHFVDVLDAAKVTIRFLHGDMDLGTGDGLLIARIQAAVAANASAATSRRVRRRLDDVAAAGRPHGGSRRPFGYEDDRVTVRADEAEIVRQMVARYLAGETPVSLTTWLNEAGIRTVAGGRWTSQTVRMKLASPRIAGLREHRGEVVGPAVWDAIISEADHRRVLARMEHLAVSGRRSPRRYLLSGLLRCHRCQQPRTQYPRTRLRRRYRLTPMRVLHSRIVP